jgi:hypothetical protein
VSYFFTDHFKTALIANQAIMNGVKVRLVLFRFAPSMGSPAPSWTSARTVAELTAQTGWVEATNVGGYPLTLQLDVGTRVVGGSRYVIYSEYPFSALTETAEVRAVGVVFIGTISGVTNPLIFVTNTPIGDVTNLKPSDALTSSPDATFPDATNRWLFGWGTTTPDPLEGPLVLSRGSPEFEVSGSQHAWLYPQRANMIANPSFEKPGTDFWSGNTALSRISGGAPGGGAWAGSCAVAAVSGYLNPVNSVTTPDPGVLPTVFTVVQRVRYADLTGFPTVATQTEGTDPRSWFLYRTPVNGRWYLEATADGTWANRRGNYTTQDQAIPPVGVDHSAAVTVEMNSAGRFYMTAWTYDETTTAWTTGTRTDCGVSLTPFDVTTLLRVGGGFPAGSRLYSVELRTGLDPAGGTVVWRFDADDYPGTGTTYTDPRGRTWTLSTAGAVTPKTGTQPGYCVMESNLFPTQMGELDTEQWTVQLMAKGTGRLKVGFVFWDADYRVTACDWGQDEEWVLNASTWTHVATHRHAPEGHIAMLRLELEGSGLTIDKVLAERGYLKDWPYFDGDEKYGARDDFSWYGGTNRQGASYSLWYNHRKAVTGRLFARTVDPNDPEANVTDEDMEEQGLVYRWVPAGITVVPHLDIFYPFDVQNPLPPKAAGVLPRYSAGTPDGVSNPW